MKKIILSTLLLLNLLNISCIYTSELPQARLTQDDYNKLAQKFFREHYLPAYTDESSIKAIQNSPLKQKLDAWLKEISLLSQDQIHKIAVRFYYQIKALKNDRPVNFYDISLGRAGSSPLITDFRKFERDAHKNYEELIRKSYPGFHSMNVLAKAYSQFITLPMHKYFYSALYNKFVRGKKIKYGPDDNKNFPSPSLIE